MMGGLLAALACAAVVQSSGPDLVLRAGEPAPSGSVLAIVPEGVVVGSGVTAPVIIGWERVREVRGEHATEAEQFAEVADMAWRAAARLGRGDVPAAEPLFERLFATYQERGGPTAAAVCEGLLRCRLRRSAHTLATGAWLAWLNARTPGDGPQWYRARADAGESVAEFPIDEATGLLPDLPPIWLDLPSVAAFAGAPPEAGGFGRRERDLAALYVHAARLATGSAGPMPEVASGDEAVRLVWDLVAAQSADEQERASGARALRARLERGPVGWEDAWVRTALARSLLLGGAPEDRERGVIELLRVRVLHGRDCPYLAGLALAEAAVALAELGDARGGSAMRREFLDRFPGHPAASWERILVWPHDAGRSGGAAALNPAQPGSPISLESRAANG
ncbi:MAG TPA: hypothetical protein VFF69_12195 [Phycisphaerales bacterium]|nr:hypothetical protein [Phycisphaerales bacterium]